MLPGFGVTNNQHLVAPVLLLAYMMEKHIFANHMPVFSVYYNDFPIRSCESSTCFHFIVVSLQFSRFVVAGIRVSFGFRISLVFIKYIKLHRTVIRWKCFHYIFLSIK